MTTIKEFIERGAYPVDDKGRALVPMASGDTAVIAATDAPGIYTLMGWRVADGRGEAQASWNEDGTKGTPSCYADLLPPPRKVKVTCWVVPFSHGGLTSLVYQTLSEAQLQAAKMGTKPIEMHGEYEEEVK